MKESIRRTLVLVLVFLIVGVALDRGIARLLDAAYARVEAGIGAIPNRALQQRAEVVVLGNSRARRHVDSDILSGALDASVYNAGCPGQSFPYMRGLLDLLLQEYTPRLVLVHVDPQMIADLGRFGRVSMLSPMMNRSEVVRDLIYEQGPWERIKYLADSYRYNDRVVEIASELPEKDRSHAGYIPRKGKPSLERLNEVMWPRSFALVEDRLGPEPDPRRVELLREMIRSAREHGAEVVLLTSPRWRPPGVAEDPRRQHLMDSLVSIAAEEGVPFVRVLLDDPEEFWDPTRFADSQHLNERGATLYSTLVAERLRALRVLEPPGSRGNGDPAHRR